jgi:mono/diheme cytochrome c family protein
MAWKALAIGLALGILFTLLMAVAVSLTVIYTGAYNVAASERHLAVVRWALDTSLRRSVAARAQDAPIPDAISPSVLAEGAQKYAATCAQCHGAPGADRAHWVRGLRPMPPELADAASEWEPREVFWIVKHGIKLSGMPAFGLEHDDEELWGITEFVMRLPGMTPEDYRALVGDSQGHAEEAH